jgi:transcriptional regulator of arginine metabolism
MDIRSKRKMKEIVRGLIGDGFEGTQLELAQALRRKGFRVTQSTVSRTLNQLGVVRQLREGRQLYRLPSVPDRSAKQQGAWADLVRSVEHNATLVVIKTVPGSAMFVAGFIDHRCKGEILGTVAGDDTIFAAPRAGRSAEAAARSINQAIE